MDPKLDTRDSLVSPPASSAVPPRVRRKGLRIFFAVFIVAMLCGLYFHNDVSLENFRTHHEAIQQWVTLHPFSAALATIVFYAVVAALSIPIGSLLTIFIGFTFGAQLGTILTVIGATLGATALFLFVRELAGSLRGGLAGDLAKRFRFLGTWSRWMEKAKRRYGSSVAFSALETQAFFYILFLRLVPVFPFWLVNLIAAFFKVRLAPFVAATAIGIIPGTFVFALLGSGLGIAFQRGEMVDLSAAISPQLIGGLVGLGFLALIPPLFQAWQRYKAQR